MLVFSGGLFFDNSHLNGNTVIFHGDLESHLLDFKILTCHVSGLEGHVSSGPPTERHMWLDSHPGSPTPVSLHCTVPLRSLDLWT